MSTTSDLPKDLQGKTIVPQLGELDIRVRFGLWKNYDSWLDQDQISDFWYDPKLLTTNSVVVSAYDNNHNFFNHAFTKFETIDIHYTFNDADTRDINFQIKILGLDSVPIRDDTGTFVSGMIEIESMKLQGIELNHLLENTMFGKDNQINFAVNVPIYSWLVKNQALVLPKQFFTPLSFS